MSAPMKKPHTKNKVFHITYQGNVYHIPKRVADEYKVRSANKVHSDSILADDLFAELDRKYTKPGVILQGLRHREGLSQINFAKKIKVTQSDLSKMEQGKRPIGKIVATRIAKQFDVNYHIFLG